jgi:phosphoribosylformylglycinamidine synthase
LVLRTAGTNCDLETEAAFELAGAAAERVHILRLREAPERLREADILALPGGFSYGDDLGAGRILGTELTRFLLDEVRALVERGGLVIGICNGFQVLVRAGLLPGGVGEAGTTPAQTATLALNRQGCFECRWIHVRVDSGRSPWLTEGAQLALPIAHAEGRFVAPEAELDRLEAAGQLVLRYTRADGSAPEAFPDNPNGSQRHVAGACDPTGRILGLMPHPERYTAFHHHPAWTRREEAERFREGEGLSIFRNAVAHLS